MFPKSPSKSMFGIWERETKCKDARKWNQQDIIHTRNTSSRMIKPFKVIFTRSHEVSRIGISTMSFSITLCPWSNYCPHDLSKMTVETTWSVIIPGHIFPPSTLGLMALPTSYRSPRKWLFQIQTQTRSRWTSNKQWGLVAPQELLTSFPTPASRKPPNICT